jgi:hypothetical protein
MADGSFGAAETAPSGNTGSSETREQSTIQFAYGDLDDGIRVARGIMTCGGVPCAADQLAAILGQTPTGGAFRGNVATARIFGLVDFVGGKYLLTELGFAITDPKRERAARADAFLKVPLYRKVYEEFRNRQLPPRPLPLEHAFVGFGVASKQKDKARQAFDRSAQQAGYFDHGSRDRLIRPAVADISGQQPGDGVDASRPTEIEPDTRDRHGGSGGGGGGTTVRGRLHPFIQGLLDSLPEPETNWAEEGRAKWLQAAANIFDLMYKGDASITVQSTKNKGTGTD